jgi:hypothetical protein
MNRNKCSENRHYYQVHSDLAAKTEEYSTETKKISDIAQMSALRATMSKTGNKHEDGVQYQRNRRISEQRKDRTNPAA